jgi:hypothetical protein
MILHADQLRGSTKYVKGKVQNGKSAGQQKLIASLIIFYLFSDSFPRNYGIDHLHDLE